MYAWFGVCDGNLCCNGLVLSLFTFLVTLSMLMNRAGCYNAREKKLILPVRPCFYRF